MTTPPPVLTLHLFPPERAALLELLWSLDDAGWSAATVCPGWSVKDIAAHLLADDLGRLSRGRDAHAPAAFTPTGSGDIEAQLLDFINRQNELWVEAARRLSPRVLTGLLSWSGEETQAYFESLDMFAIGDPVHWAGPDPAPVWLDIAREYSERWIHQMQIRDAVGAPPLTEPRLFVPLLDTLAWALPHTLRDTPAPYATHIKLTVTLAAKGASDLDYSVVRVGDRWSLQHEVTSTPDATVTMDGDTAWRLFTKGIPRAQALAKTTITGNRALAEKILDTVSIIA